jgi:hypothetical protein
VRQRLSKLAATWISLLLCAGVAGAWAWSSHTPRIATYRHLERRDAVILWNGKVAFMHIIFPQPAEGWLLGSSCPLLDYVVDRNLEDLTGWRRLAGVAFRTRTSVPPGNVTDATDGSQIWLTTPAMSRTLVMPLWMIVLATAALPALHVRRWLRRQKRRAAGLCLTCGYDLRATPGRCPECGTESEQCAGPRRFDRPTRTTVATVGVTSILLCVAAAALLPLRASSVPDVRRSRAITGPIARFTFDRGTNDEAGCGASAQLKDAPIESGTLILTGLYDFGGPGPGHRAVFLVPRLDYRCFTVIWRFRADGAGLVVLSGGESYRWLTLIRTPNGCLRVGFNDNQLVRELPDVNVPLGSWTQMACSVDLAQRRVLVMLDGGKVADIPLPEDFAFAVTGSDAERNNRLFTFTNYSNGDTFGGRLDDLTVYPRAMSEAELAQLARAAAH